MGTFSAPGDRELQALARTCHKRRSAAFEPLKRLAGQGEPRRRGFEHLYELLCKLGQHVHTAGKPIEAAVSLSQDFTGGCCVEALPSSKEQRLPLTPKDNHD